MSNVNAARKGHVPGSLVLPNTRTLGFHVSWWFDEHDRTAWTWDWVGDDGVVWVYSEGWTESYDLGVRLPDVPVHPVSSPAEYAAMLQARFNAHPLANQVPAPVRDAERLLAAGSDPLEIFRHSLRWSCPGGAARAFGKVLSARGTADRVLLKRMARQSLVLKHTTLQHLGDDSFGPDSSLLPLVEKALPFQPLRQNHVDLGVAPSVPLRRIYDEHFTRYLRDAKRVVDHLLAQPLDRLDAATPLVPRSSYVPLAEGLEEAETLLRAPAYSDDVRRHFGRVWYALLGHPLEAVRPTLAWILNGIPPAAVSSPVAAGINELGLHADTVTQVARMILDSDQDFRGLPVTRILR